MSEQQVLSACPHDCSDTCAIITTERDGMPVEVRGNPAHPLITTVAELPIQSAFGVQPDEFDDLGLTDAVILHP